MLKYVEEELERVNKNKKLLAEIKAKKKKSD